MVCLYLGRTENNTNAIKKIVAIIDTGIDHTALVVFMENKKEIPGNK